MSSRLGRFLVVVVAGAALFATSLALVAPQVGAMLRAGDVADAEVINLDPLAQRSVVLAADGTVLTHLLVEENRISVALDEVSDTFIDTLLAIEDDRFYEHDGVNLRATARALLTNVSAGGVEQGGSTITQQLVKNALVGSEQSLERKVQEAVLSRRLEDQMSKNEILERYINTVYLGNSTYGVQA
ncbi:MAG: biosynthetic peptidoglycan transglycosylase, partial [Acidimicrobiales bacterium]